MAELAKNKVVLTNVRLSYLHVFEPHSIEGEEKKKYSVSIILPKSDKAQIAKVNAAMDVAKEMGKTSKAKWKGKVPANLYTALQDGDINRADDEAYENAFYINANSNTKPGVVDRNLNPILNQDELYSGCYGAVSITFFPYDTPKNGIAAGLNHVMKLRDGEPLGGRSTAENDFADLELEDDDLGL